MNKTQLYLWRLDKQEFLFDQQTIFRRWNVLGHLKQKHVLDNTEQAIVWVKTSLSVFQLPSNSRYCSCKFFISFVCQFMPVSFFNIKDFLDTNIYTYLHLCLHMITHMLTFIFTLMFTNLLHILTLMFTHMFNSCLHVFKHKFAFIFTLFTILFRHILHQR